MKAGASALEVQRSKQQQQLKRDLRKGKNVGLPAHVGTACDLTSLQRGKICLSKSGFKSHQRLYMYHNVIV